MQFRVKDLAERAIAYGIPGVIVDGTDACQVYDACTKPASERGAAKADADRSENDAHERPRHSRCGRVCSEAAV